MFKCALLFELLPPFINYFVHLHSLPSIYSQPPFAILYPVLFTPPLLNTLASCCRFLLILPFLSRCNLCPLYRAHPVNPAPSVALEKIKNGLLHLLFSISKYPHTKDFWSFQDLIMSFLQRHGVFFSPSPNAGYCRSQYFAGNKHACQQGNFIQNQQIKVQKLSECRFTESV